MKRVGIKAKVDEVGQDLIHERPVVAREPGEMAKEMWNDGGGRS